MGDSYIIPRNLHAAMACCSIIRCMLEMDVRYYGVQYQAFPWSPIQLLKEVISLLFNKVKESGSLCLCNNAAILSCTPACHTYTRKEKRNCGWIAYVDPSSDRIGPYKSGRRSRNSPHAIRCSFIESKSNCCVMMASSVRFA